MTAFIVITLQLKAQTTFEIDQNNAHALISDNGFFFTNQTNGVAGYEIPAGSGNQTMFAMSFWMGGLDDADQLHFAGQTYIAGEDLFAGPIANDYNSPYYLATYPSAIWKVTKAQINFHINNFTGVGYTADPAIANWPGNGNVSEGIAQQLAPYVDVNNDQIYNPMDGDYPYIQGDQAVYVIMNDAAGDHTATGADSLGVEIHVMFYQYNTADAIDNTTFMNVKLYNRSSTNYHDFYFGLFMDYDLGSSVNDYVGCDSTRNLSYVYNGEDTDDGQGGQPGYGANTPAFGSMMLNEPMGTFLYYNIGGGANGDPNSAVDQYYYLQGIWQNGAHMLYGGNGFNSGTTLMQSNYMFTGNPYLNTGWTEISEGNPPGDRRAVMSTAGHDFLANASNCIDVAFIYNRDGADHLENVNELLGTADFVQNFYDNNIQPCNQIFLENVEKSSSNFTIFPNPSDGNFYVNVTENTTVVVFNLNGQIVATENCVEGKNQIQLDLSNGFYIVQLKTNETISYVKIEVIK